MEPATPIFHVLQPRQSSNDGSNRGGGSNSASGIVSTLIPVLIISSIIFVVFLVVRSKVARVYRPRTLDYVLHQEPRRTPESGGKTAGLFSFKTLPDSFVLHHNSLDGYLFLRFFKLLITISVVGVLITWPVLFPVNITGGGGQMQLDKLSFSNVISPTRYYAHALVGWVFLGFVMLAIAHERMFFIGVRQAYFLSPLRAQRLTSRTVLFQNIPENCRNVAALREVFGHSVRRVWLAQDCKKLEEAVKDRGKAAIKLEGGETKMITQAYKAMIKDTKGKSAQKHEEGGSQATQYLDKQKRPTHKLKFLIGKKVDTVDWSRDEIPKMNRDIKEQQDRKLDGHDAVGAAFVEFSSQYAAQKALQLASTGKKHMEYKPRYIDVQPEEVIWKNLKMSLAQKKAMTAVATVGIVLMTIFWTPITAFVGALTNINYLTNLVPFLSFINSVPQVILGVITGLLPTLVLVVLLILVPIICRLLAKLSGAPTLSEVELKTQSWYFIFQVIQVFLVTTFASGASAVTTQIINNPSSAPTLLAENLPKASNFYISYFIVYGLMQAALQLALIAPLLIKTILGGLLDKTPRKQYSRWTALAGLGWGSEYPKWTNLGVIALSYAMIAPLVLGFSAVGFTLLYIAFRHNWLFVFGNNIDMKGEAYARALKQLTTGIYLSTVCLIGLFIIGTTNSPSGAGPLAIMIAFLVVLIIFNVLLNKALGPLEQYLPLDMLEHNEASMWTAHGPDSGHSHTNGQSTLENGTKEAIPHHEQSDVQAKDNKLTQRVRPIINDRFFSILSRSAPVVDSHAKIDTDIEDPDTAYFNPAIISPDPLIWLPRDNMGVSQILRRGNEEKGVKTSDDHAWLNQKGKVEWDTTHSEDVDRMLGRWRSAEKNQKQDGKKDFATGGGQGMGNTGHAG